MASSMTTERVRQWGNTKKEINSREASRKGADVESFGVAQKPWFPEPESNENHPGYASVRSGRRGIGCAWQVRRLTACGSI